MLKLKDYRLQSNFSRIIKKNSNIVKEHKKKFNTNINVRN